MSAQIRILLFLLAFCEVAVRSTTGYRALLSALTGSNYSIHIRPVRFENQTMDIDLQLSVYLIRDMNPKTQILHANAWVQVSWRDLFLQWHPPDYNGTLMMTIPADLIWTPDLILFNSADHERTAQEVFDDTMVTVRSGGFVYWSVPVIFKSSCKFNPTRYPFDTQKCPVTFGSWNYNTFEVNITSRLIKQSKTATKIMSESGEWELDSIVRKIVRRKKVHRDGNFPFITFTLTLDRMPQFYIVHLLIPSVMLMVIGVLVFLMPSESGEKVGLASTVLLSMTVFMLYVMGRIPPSSDGISMFARYFIGTMALLSIETYASVLVLHAHYNGTRASRFTRHFFLGILGPILGERRTEGSAISVWSEHEREVDEVVSRAAMSDFGAVEGGGEGGGEGEGDYDDDDDDNRSRSLAEESYIESEAATELEAAPPPAAPTPAAPPPAASTPRRPSQQPQPNAQQQPPAKPGALGTLDVTASGTNVPGEEMDSEYVPTMELLVFADIFQVLLEIFDELRECHAVAAPKEDALKLIAAEWRSIGNIADRICLMFFAVLNISFFIVVFKSE